MIQVNRFYAAKVEYFFGSWANYPEKYSRRVVPRWHQKLGTGSRGWGLWSGSGLAGRRCVRWRGRCFAGFFVTELTALSVSVSVLLSSNEASCLAIPGGTVVLWDLTTTVASNTTATATSIATMPRRACRVMSNKSFISLAKIVKKQEEFRSKSHKSRFYLFFLCKK